MYYQSNNSNMSLPSSLYEIRTNAKEVNSFNNEVLNLLFPTKNAEVQSSCNNNKSMNNYTNLTGLIHNKNQPQQEHTFYYHSFESFPLNYHTSLMNSTHCLLTNENTSNFKTCEPITTDYMTNATTINFTEQSFEKLPKCTNISDERVPCENGVFNAQTNISSTCTCSTSSESSNKIVKQTSCTHVSKKTKKKKEIQWTISNQDLKKEGKMKMNVDLSKEKVDKSVVLPIKLLAFNVGLSKDKQKSWRFRDIRRSLFEKMSPEQLNFIDLEEDHSLLKERLPHKLNYCNFSKRIMLLVFHFILRDGKEPKFFTRPLVQREFIEKVLMEQDNTFYNKVNCQSAFEVHNLWIKEGKSFEEAINLVFKGEVKLSTNLKSIELDDEESIPEKKTRPKRAAAKRKLVDYKDLYEDDNFDSSSE
ncbi:hypothetical protein ABK040_007876 [Willaertia magna]